MLDEINLQGFLINQRLSTGDKNKNNDERDGNCSPIMLYLAKLWKMLENTKTSNLWKMKK